MSQLQILQDPDEVKRRRDEGTGKPRDVIEALGEWSLSLRGARNPFTRRSATADENPVMRKNRLPLARVARNLVARFAAPLLIGALAALPFLVLIRT